MKERGFKQQVKKAKGTILDNDKEWYDNFVKENFPKKEPIKEKKRNNSPWLVVCAALAVIAAMISVCIVFRAAPESVVYLRDRESRTESNIAELIRSTDYVNFDIDKNYNSSIERIYDLDSSDTLYFNLTLTNKYNALETITVWVYVNRFYDDRNKVSEKYLTKDLEKYTVLYDKEVKGEESPFTVQYNATAKYKDVEVYFEYSQMCDNTQGDFFEFVQGFFKPIDG